MTDIRKICHCCDGQGQVDTGIDESPVTVCNYCNGTGVNPFYQAGFDAAIAQQRKPMGNVLKVERTSDQSVLVVFRSCRAASEFETKAAHGIKE